jgi:hypothetical protein
MHALTNHIWLIKISYNILIYISNIFASLLFSHTHYFTLASIIYSFFYYQMHVSPGHIHHLKISHNTHLNISNIFASLLFSYTHSFTLAFNNNRKPYNTKYNTVQASTSYIFHFKFLHNIHIYISILSVSSLFLHTHYFILAFIITIYH